MPYCECKPGSAVEILGHFEKAVLSDGGWTSFYLHRCLTCGRLGGFPTDNFNLAVTRGGEEVQQILMSHEIDDKIKEEIDDIRDKGDHFSPRGWIKVTADIDKRRTKIGEDPEFNSNDGTDTN